MHPDFSTQQKETVTMRFTKRGLVKTAAVSSALLGAIAVAAPASANSFGPTDYATGRLHKSQLRRRETTNSASQEPARITQESP